MKKIIAIILSCMFILASCGASNETPDSDGKNGKVNSSNKNEEETVEEVEIPEVEVIDFTGVEPAPESDFTFFFDSDDRLFISRYKGNDEIVVIPETFKGKPIIGGGIKFCENTTVRGVKIPEGFVYISSSSFEGCSNLITVEIPNTVEEISDRAFFNCSLTTLNIPDSVQYIERQAFKYNDFYEVTIPGSVRTLGQEAFHDCPNLKNVVIEDSDVEMKIVRSAIWAENSVTVPARATEIGDYAIRVTDGKIYCPAGSAAEEFAKNNEYEYELIP